MASVWIALNIVALLIAGAIVYFFVSDKGEAPAFFREKRWGITEATFVSIMLQLILLLDRFVVDAFLGSEDIPFIVKVFFATRHLIYAPVILLVIWLSGLKLRQLPKDLGISANRWGQQILMGLKWSLIFPTIMMSASLLRPIERTLILMKQELGESVLNANIAYWGLPVAISLVLSFVVVLTTLEECIYRGIYYGALRKKMNVFPAILISSSFFAVAHGGFDLRIFALGCLLAYLYEKSHSLLSPIAAHFTVNLFRHILSSFVNSSTTSFVAFLNIGAWVLLVVSFIVWGLSSFLNKRQSLSGNSA